MPRRPSGVAMKPCRNPFATSPTSSFSSSRPIPGIHLFISSVLVDFAPHGSGRTTERSQLTHRTVCFGSGSGRMRITIASSPNKRMEPTAPAFQGSHMFVNDGAARRSLRASR